MVKRMAVSSHFLRSEWFCRNVFHGDAVSMFARALLAFLVLPGMAAFVIPALIASIDPWRGDLWWPGGTIVLVGTVLLLWCVRDFYQAGQGTLAPWDPPTQMVVIGLYRFVRNPMYLGVLLLILGWAALLQSVLLVAYSTTLFVAFHARVVLHEEPWLEMQFSTTWLAYRQNVGRWVPRLFPWRPTTADI